MFEKSGLDKSRVDVSFKEKMAFAGRANGLRQKIEMLLVPNRSKNEKIKEILLPVSQYKELYQHLKKFGGIKTTKNGFTPSDKLIKFIDDFREFKPGSSIKRITREGGLRNKVKELEIKNTERGFYQLFHNIRRIQEIESSKGVIYSEELILIIQAVRKKKLPLDAIVDTIGLRDKVEDLMKIDAELTAKISRVNRFDDLFVVLTEIGGLDSSQGYRSATVLIDLIKKVINKKVDLNDITNTGGLRNKVRMLATKNGAEFPVKRTEPEPVAQS